ncbi:MAG: right-handed parallel beta-helix repeat-containing protein [Deltaproteobacteria bacterium]|nr:right-handed parallel beta-helix repeat-containing protein [Deltaproteobacteria bacterium]
MIRIPLNGEGMGARCAAWAAAVVLVAGGCDTRTLLVAEPSDGGSDASGEVGGDGLDGVETDRTDDRGGDGGDLPPDGPSFDTDALGDEFADEGRESGDDATDGAGDDGAATDAEPSCPVWVVPAATGSPEDGSAENPFVGLRRALEARGSCAHIVLRDSSPESPFEAAVEIAVAAGEILTIEGDPAEARPVELDARDGIGLSAGGGGSLVLRHLAVRNGRGPSGGCLDALVGSLRLEDTEWTGCRADAQCSAVAVTAAAVDIVDSRFLSNEVLGDTPSSWGAIGTVCIDGPVDTAHVLVERCRIEDNQAGEGAPLWMRARTEDATVQDCLFLRNGAHIGASAVEGHVGSLAHCRFADNGVMSEAPTVWLEAGPRSRVVHNVFIDNRAARGASALELSQGLVANNLFVRNGCSDSPGSGWCLSAVWVSPRSGGGSVDLRNNTFVDNASVRGIAHLAFDSAYGAVHSNLFVGGAGTAAVGTVHPELTASAELRYNAWWDVPEPVWGDGIRVGDGNAEADPLFAGGDDYRLGPGSAAIDAGDPDPSLSDPDGTRSDVGAFGGPEGDWIPLEEGGAP